MRPIARIIFLLTLPLVLWVGGAPYGWATPTPDHNLLAPEPPSVTARSWILYDDTFDKVLAEEAADERAAIASTTKIMTALIVIERSQPDEPVEITKRAASTGESEIGLVADEAPWSVEEMLAALLLRSANDSAVALAEHVGGSVPGFAELMNRKASQLGLTNSGFVNPHGLDHADHYSSAHDLLLLSIAAMEQPRFSQLVTALSVNLPAAPDGTPRVALNRNRLMVDYPGALGIKTGYTGRALQTFVAAAERGGRRIYAVVLGSTQHFDDATALLDYGFDQFGPTTLVPVTSDRPRPLAGGLGVVHEEGFELFPETDRNDSPPATALVTPPVPPPTYPDVQVETVDPPEEEEQVERVVEPVERQPLLPGIAEAILWFRRYWNLAA